MTRKLKAPQGSLTLDELQRATQKRLGIAGGSAVLCATLGVLLVAFLMPPQEEATATEEPAAEQEQLAPKAKTAPPVAHKDTPQPNKETEPAPTPKTKEKKPALVETPPAEKPPQEVAEKPPEEEKTPEPPTETVTENKPKEADLPTTWWKDIKGKRCSILFPEGSERLIMREGKLDRDEETTYGPFVENEIVARVRKARNQEVTVHKLGFHPRNKRPSLAYVTLHWRGEEKKGILPLQISKQQVKLKPVSP